MIQSRKFKQLTVWALLGLLTSWVVSCSTGNFSSSTKPVASEAATIEFWTMQLQPQFTDYFQNLISSFESQNPSIKVKWVDVPWSAMENKILTAVSAKTPPDVVNLNPDFASQLAGRNAWLDLDAKVSSEVRSSYLPNIWQASTLNGKSFGIPWYLTTRLTIYNTDLLKQAGINKAPATYAELGQAAQQIKDKTGKYAFFATFVPQDSGEVLESFVQMGVTLVNAEGKAGFNTPQGKAAFQYWVDLYKKGLLPKESLTQGHRHAVDLYQSGETALLASGPEFLKTISNNAPKIAQASAIAPQITGDTGKKNVAVMNIVIPRATKNPDAAVKFALFVTNDENQLEFAKAANVLPSTVKALGDSYFKDAPANASTVEKGRFLSAQQMAKAEVLTPKIKDFKFLQKTIYENLQAAMLGEKTVDQAVEDAAQQWDNR
ncbi:sugar ABC transporter substrate-binding protein [Anabaena cylindrica FACHB-243]|uniref:Carbohydrate ABC transporter substrate-binding protein, CUT1 family n=1 Tax=Anabaena cylindrica (strain ATCC 27899 / PCC 7122) TaxID=272123 RepID=K9ZEC3_ANACC|nr:MULTISPECIES: sugar ABC transporter substrate-binding protein [Anabaena]AFZ57541.1 carbohydrate ABC transporter substrate-binding protein, CUT1 family [Anabaena cylindrica PCC 7122]MBD2418478.1 sugar ABC transporter substrate-binding protein [Anabaena cylindrica FACHB-243]MBY5283689.1 sugar ABC transporter substrate-binding protein [Anabaena sp. CCAP 1446/1C]MBY5308465.1 sugar ABC transporter substrate-binding protein [Anabaena sp. CCAP 1446/1C]MCM2405094.1 sugar ABC transporter substrate-b